MQLFHHGTTIRGSWDLPSRHLVSILGFDNTTKPIQIVQKPIKDLKFKSRSFKESTTGLDSIEHFQDLKNPTVDFIYKNILLIPNLLMKTFMNLPSTDSYSVAKAFFEQMYHYDSQFTINPPNEH
jgi:hypothetical protein